MRFQATHKLVTYLLVLAAFATLASTGALSVPMALVFLGLCAVSWRIDAGGPKAALLDRRLPFVRVLVGAVLVQRVWVTARQLPEPDLVPVVEFVLVALAAKLYYRRNNRDDVHVFVLSFLLVLAAAALGGSFLFAAGFVAYVLVATWALMLFHLRREMEENYLVKHSAQAPSQKVGIERILNSRRVVGAPFFAATGVVALGVSLGAVATFTFVPRVGAGFVFGAPRATTTLVGFSDDVSLGHYGTLSTDNPVVALRATVPRIAALPSAAERERAVDALYWRGTVYDSYDRGHWTRSRAPALRTVLAAHPGDGLVLVGDGAALDPSPGAPHEALEGRLGRLDRQEIDLVGQGAPVAFALDRPVAYELPQRRAGAPGELQLAPRWSGEVGLLLAPTGAGPIGDGLELEDAGRPGGRPELRTPPNVHYVAESIAAAFSVRSAEPAVAPALSAEARATYLQLPATLAPRVTTLARQLVPARTDGGPQPVAAVESVTRWLRATHQYTLQMPHPAAGLDPVESFLFETPAGHCEYFASATALLLRAAGVPTRYVNGYLGGEWNDIGHYVAVRDNRAHSWIEAFVDGAGWVRVDATPPLPTTARAGRARQLFDSLDFRWARGVVGYDLGRQLELVRRFTRAVGVHAPDAPRGPVPSWAFVLGAVVVVAAAASRVWPTRAPAQVFGPRVPATGAPVQRLYDRALARLARAGVPRRAAETPREYAARVARVGLDPGATLAELTEVYSTARFGGRDVDREVLRGLARRLARLGRGASVAAG